MSLLPALAIVGWALFITEVLSAVLFGNPLDEEDRLLLGAVAFVAVLILVFFF